MKKNLIRIISIVLIILLLLNMLLLALGKIKDVLFWIIILLGGASSFLINRLMKKKD